MRAMAVIDVMMWNLYAIEYRIVYFWTLPGTLPESQSQH
jgi:hypothetical protein